MKRILSLTDNTTLSSLVAVPMSHSVFAFAVQAEKKYQR